MMAWHRWITAILAKLHLWDLILQLAQLVTELWWMRRCLLLCLNFFRFAVRTKKQITFYRWFVHRNLVFLTDLDHAELACRLAKLNNWASIDNRDIGNVLLPGLVLRHCWAFRSKSVAKKWSHSWLRLCRIAKSSLVLTDSDWEHCLLSFHFTRVGWVLGGFGARWGSSKLLEQCRCQRISSWDFRGIILSNWVIERIALGLAIAVSWGIRFVLCLVIIIVVIW